MKKNLVVFSGSQDIADADLKNEVIKQFEAFLTNNKEKINTILFWWSRVWVMWIVFDTAAKVWVTIKWYSLEQFRIYDEGNWVDMDFFPDDYSRISRFKDIWDVFLVLPWWEWTIREVWFVVDMLDVDTNKNVYVSGLFDVYVDMLEKLDAKWMLYPKDRELKKIVNDLSEVEL